MTNGSNVISRSWMQPAKVESSHNRPWYSLSELAMVRSFFYPDRSPLEPPMEEPTTPYRDSSGRFVNTFIPPTFAQRDEAFRESRLPRNGSKPEETRLSFTKKLRQQETILSQQQFVPDNPENCRLEAVKIVQKVTAQYGDTNPLPHAVVATSQLTAALLHVERISEEWRQYDYDPVTIFSVESILGTALSKFVTGLVDRDIKLEMKEDKAKSKMKKRKADDTNGGSKSETDSPARVSNSMLSNAAQIGLPADFVDLRHRITHESMPSISNLKLMAFRALDWLWDKYWVKIDVGNDIWGMEERNRLKRLNDPVSQPSNEDDSEEEEGEEYEKALKIPTKVTGIEEQTQSSDLGRPEDTMDENP